MGVMVGASVAVQEVAEPGSVTKPSLHMQMWAIVGASVGLRVGVEVGAGVAVHEVEDAGFAV